MEVSLESFKKRFTYDPQRDLLGKGGFGEVYKAYDNEDKCYVAIKIYTGSADSKYTLINEVKRFKKLRHPNIIEHIEAYEVTTGSNDIHGKPIIYQIGILEYADGGTLADLMKKGISDKHMLEDLAKDILEGLSYLHRNNIIHRDLKPSNILLYKDGEKLKAKITDFGIAKQTDVTSQSTQLVGTVEYMAPEFFTNSNNLTPAADIWSFGVILLEAVTGIHAFGKTSTGSASEQAADLHSTLQSVPIPFKEVIIRSLVRDPTMRSGAETLIAMFEGDNNGGKTVVIGPKPKPITAEVNKTRFRFLSLFDFDISDRKWKLIFARELLIFLVGIVLCGLLILMEFIRLKTQDLLLKDSFFYFLKSHSISNQLPYPWEILPIEFEWLIQPIGLFVFIIFYPIRLFIASILWSLKTMGIQIDFPVLNGKPRKRIKLIGVLLLIMAGLIFLGKVGYEKWNAHKRSGLAERLNENIVQTDSTSVTSTTPVLPEHLVPVDSLITPKLPVLPKGYTPVEEKQLKKQVTMTYILIISFSSPMSFDIHAPDDMHVSDIIKVKNITNEKEYKIKEYAQERGYPKASIDKFQTFDEAAARRELMFGLPNTYRLNITANDMGMIDILSD